ncbi:uncharacterized protein PAC_09677 [Phialocephala subalpina]|uniref:Uncharacterized protein n=1 Tax=Phialocephala subalpina TaxID=576137 RepID=A0A1L7X435_9HELO|nr:uncharacterized protein PAC_09677 [Phialocephala subalpina]
MVDTLESLYSGAEQILHFAPLPDYQSDYTAIPSVLQVHQESRDEFLPRYPVLFDGSYDMPFLRLRGGCISPGHGGSRFNPALDVLVRQHSSNFNHPHWSELTAVVPEEQLAFIRYLAMDVNWLRAEQYLSQHFAHLSGLQTIFAVGDNTNAFVVSMLESRPEMSIRTFTSMMDVVQQ